MTPACNILIVRSIYYWEQPMKLLSDGGTEYATDNPNKKRTTQSASQLASHWILHKTRTAGRRSELPSLLFLRNRQPRDELHKRARRLPAWGIPRCRHRPDRHSARHRKAGSGQRLVEDRPRPSNRLRRQDAKGQHRQGKERVSRLYR